MDPFLGLIGIAGGGLLFLFIVFTSFIPIPLWLEAKTCGAHVGLIDFLLFRFRGINPTHLVKPLIMASKADIGINLDQLETHLLSGGDVDRVVAALISASSAKLPLDFQTAAAIDKAGRDVLEAVRVCVTPKVIITNFVENVAKDGIQVMAKAQITVKANINRLVGGAGEETIVARVGEGICTRIGSCNSHKEVLENPDSISEYVISKGLDRNTAYEILSIDIADVNVGKNVGAALQIDQAEADKKIAEAKASERVANARAEREEMIAKEQESKARLVDAQAKIPLAMAEALMSGKLTVMDYHKLKNVEADTQMRQSIAHLGPELSYSEAE